MLSLFTQKPRGCNRPAYSIASAALWLQQSLSPHHPLCFFLPLSFSFSLPTPSLSFTLSLLTDFIQLAFSLFLCIHTHSHLYACFCCYTAQVYLIFFLPIHFRFSLGCLCFVIPAGQMSPAATLQSVCVCVYGHPVTFPQPLSVMALEREQAQCTDAFIP